MKIAFAGTPEIASTILQSIIDKKDHQVVCVITSVDKPAGRGRKLKPSPVKKIALENNLTLMQPDSPKNEEFIHEFKKYQPDILIVMAYGHILTEELLETPNYGSVNIHASLLPKYRGAAPIQRAILNGDKKSGLTFMKMTKGLDSGPMSKRFEITIDKDDTSADLTKKMASLAAKEINQFCSDWPNLIDSLEEQKETDATYCPKITRKDALIEWSGEAKKISKTINAMYPNPIVSIDVNGIEVNLCKSKVNKSLIGDPGEIIEFNKNILAIGCGDFSVEVTELCRTGKNKLSIKDFYNGAQKLLKKGDIIS